MHRLKISEAASNAIRIAFERSGLESPVAQLGTISQAVSLSPEFLAALDEDSTEDLLELGKLESTRHDTLKYSLHIFTRDASECLSEHIQPLEDLRFCIPTELLRLFDEHVLDYVDDRFVMRRADGQPLEALVEKLVSGTL